LRKDWRSFDGENSENICIICKSVLNTFIEYRRQGMSEEDIKNKVIKICTLLKLQSPQVCDGVVTINLVSKLNCYTNKIKLKIFYYNIKNFFIVI